MYRGIIVCFNGSGTKIPIRYLFNIALSVVASGDGGNVGRCCCIFMLVSHKSVRFGGLDGGRFAFVCANQISGFWGANSSTILKGLSSLRLTHITGDFIFT